MKKLRRRWWIVWKEIERRDWRRWDIALHAPTDTRWPTNQATEVLQDPTEMDGLSDHWRMPGTWPMICADRRDLPIGKIQTQEKKKEPFEIQSYPYDTKFAIQRAWSLSQSKHHDVPWFQPSKKQHAKPLQQPPLPPTTIINYQHCATYTSRSCLTHIPHLYMWSRGSLDGDPVSREELKTRRKTVKPW